MESIQVPYGPEAVNKTHPPRSNSESQTRTIILNIVNKFQNYIS